MWLKITFEQNYMLKIFLIDGISVLVVEFEIEHVVNWIKYWIVGCLQRVYNIGIQLYSKVNFPVDLSNVTTIGIQNT